MKNKLGGIKMQKLTYEMAKEFLDKNNSKIKSVKDIKIIVDYLKKNNISTIYTYKLIFYRLFIYNKNNKNEI